MTFELGPFLDSLIKPAVQLLNVRAELDNLTQAAAAGSDGVFRADRHAGPAAMTHFRKEFEDHVQRRCQAGICF